MNDYNFLTNEQAQMVDYHFPPFSEKRKQIRKQWNQYAQRVKWDLFLLNATLNKIIKSN